MRLIIVAMLMLAGCTQPAADLPPCTGDALTVTVTMAPEPETYHGVYVRALQEEQLIDSDIADKDGCADLAPPPGDYTIDAQLQTTPECGWSGQQAVTYAGGKQQVTVQLEDTC